MHPSRTPISQLARNRMQTANFKGLMTPDCCHDVHAHVMSSHVHDLTNMYLFARHAMSCLFVLTGSISKVSGHKPCQS